MHEDGAADEAMLPNQIKRAPAMRCMPMKPCSKGWKFFVLGDRITRTVVSFFWDDGIALNAKVVKATGNPCQFGGACIQRLFEDVKMTGVRSVST